MENLDPPSPPNQGWENGAFLPFARLHPWFGGDGGLLFHFILSKIVERSPAPIGIVKPHCPSLPCLYPSAPVLGSPKGVATVIVNSMFPHSYFITKMFVRHARILKHLLFRRIYQAIVSAYKFFDFHFPGTGQVSRKRNLCGNRRAETGLIQHCAGHRTSL